MIEDIEILGKTVKSNSYSIDIYSCLALPHHVYVKDLNHVYVECNLSQARSLGFEHGGDLIGKVDWDFYNEKETKDILYNDKQVIKTERPLLIVEYASFINKPLTPMLSYKIPLRNGRGKLIGILGTSINITGQNLFPLNMDIGMKPTDVSLQDAKNISKREKECLYFLARGMTAKQIARILDLSPRTVEFYIDNLKKKFNCNNRTELIAKIMNMTNLPSDEEQQD